MGHVSSQEVEGWACSPPLKSIPLTMREDETQRAGQGVETQVNLDAKGCVPFAIVCVCSHLHFFIFGVELLN